MPISPLPIADAHTRFVASGTYILIPIYASYLSARNLSPYIEIVPSDQPGATMMSVPGFVEISKSTNKLRRLLQACPQPPHVLNGFGPGPK